MPSRSHSIISILQALRQIPPVGSHHRHPPSGSSANNFRQRHQSAPSVGTLHRHPPSAAFVSTLCRYPQSAPSVGTLRRHSGNANYHAPFALPGGPPEFFQRFFAGGVNFFFAGGVNFIFGGGAKFSLRDFWRGGAISVFQSWGAGIVHYV